jgi:hypothetical protein
MWDHARRMTVRKGVKKVYSLLPDKLELEMAVPSGEMTFTAQFARAVCDDTFVFF